MSDFSNSDFSFSAPAPPPAAQLFTEYQGEHFTPPVVLGDGQYRRVDMPDGSIFQKEGGFGRVYCYQHKKRNTLYALKTPKKTAAIYSIEWELEILNDLNDCEFIVTVHYVEKWKDQMYLMMIPFASKGSLTACLDRYLPRDQYFLYKAVHVIWQVAKGLEYAHKKGYVHADLKPDNILVYDFIRIHGLDETCELLQVEICDFGVAHKRENGFTVNTNSAGTGTEGYQAPEQILYKGDDSNEICPKTDVWSLYITFIQILLPKDEFRTIYTMLRTIRTIFKEPYTPDSRTAVQREQYVDHEVIRHIHSSLNSFLDKLFESDDIAKKAYFHKYPGYEELILDVKDKILVLGALSLKRDIYERANLNENEVLLLINSMYESLAALHYGRMYESEGFRDKPERNNVLTVFELAISKASYYHATNDFAGAIDTYKEALAYYSLEPLPLKITPEEAKKNRTLLNYITGMYLMIWGISTGAKDLEKLYAAENYMKACVGFEGDLNGKEPLDVPSEWEDGEKSVFLSEIARLLMNTRDPINWDRVDELLEKALILDLTNKTALTTYATLQLGARGQYQQAFKLFEYEIVVSGSPSVDHILACMAHGRRDPAYYTQAREGLEILVKINPDDPKVINMLAYFYQGLGSGVFENAETVIESKLHCLREARKYYQALIPLLSNEQLEGLSPLYIHVLKSLYELHNDVTSGKELEKFKDEAAQVTTVDVNNPPFPWLDALPDPLSRYEDEASAANVDKILKLYANFNDSQDQNATPSDHETVIFDEHGLPYANYLPVSTEEAASTSTTDQTNSDDGDGEVKYVPLVYMPGKKI